MSDFETDVETELANVEGLLSDPISDLQAEIDDPGLGTDWIPEEYRKKNVLIDMITALFDDNPFTAILDTVSIAPEGSDCEFDYAWNTPNGQSFNIKFSICAFDSVLQLFGSVLLSICSLNALIIIFKR